MNCGNSQLNYLKCFNSRFENILVDQVWVKRKKKNPTSSFWITFFLLKQTLNRTGINPRTKVYLTMYIFDAADQIDCLIENAVWVNVKIERKWEAQKSALMGV